LRATAERVGIYYPGFGWHVFRHTHATWFDAQVAPETQAQMGHATAGMTAHYRHQTWERKEGAVRRMQEMVVGETEGVQ
jgi:integrase